MEKEILENDMIMFQTRISSIRNSCMFLKCVECFSIGVHPNLYRYDKCQHCRNQIDSEFAS
jgi:hypothetical protein